MSGIFNLTLASSEAKLVAHSLYFVAFINYFLFLIYLFFIFYLFIFILTYLFAFRKSIFLFPSRILRLMHALSEGFFLAYPVFMMYVFFCLNPACNIYNCKHDIAII